MMLLTLFSTVLFTSVYGFNCSSKYPNTYFITEDTLDAHFSTAVSSSRESRSILECSKGCEPADGCAGVVFHDGHCHFMSDGSALKAAAVSQDSDVLKLILYETDPSYDSDPLCDTLRCKYYCDCSACNTQEPMYVDCKYLRDIGRTTSGVYLIKPDGSSEFEAYCDMTTAGGGWTVFQRRVDASVDFYRGWAHYVAGFGDLEGNLWAGLDHLHAMAPDAGGLYGVELYIYLDTLDGASASSFARFSTFGVSAASSLYTLAVGGYSGTAGDSMAYHNGMEFSTHDADNDEYLNNCASMFTAGWWYKACCDSHLNGVYGDTTGKKISYNGSKRNNVVMMVRRK